MISSVQNKSVDAAAAAAVATLFTVFKIISLSVGYFSLRIEKTYRCVCVYEIERGVFLLLFCWGVGIFESIAITIISSAQAQMLPHTQTHACVYTIRVQQPHLHIACNRLYSNAYVCLSVCVWVSFGVCVERSGATNSKNAQSSRNNNIQR